jgi:hypothetical protein
MIINGFIVPFVHVITILSKKPYDQNAILHVAIKNIYI